MKKIALFISLLMPFFLAMPLMAAPPRGTGGIAGGKIGIVDMQKVLRDSKNARNIRTAPSISSHTSPEVISSGLLGP
mgnify:CR=1 FL=1